MADYVAKPVRTVLLRRAAPSKLYSLSLCWKCLATPGAFVLVVAFILPMVLLLSQSFMKDGRYGIIVLQISLQNYITFLTDPFYLRIFAHTFAIGATTASICALLAYPVAYQISRCASKVRALLIFLVLGPLMVSTVIRNMGWFPILSGTGLINNLLIGIHIIKHPIQMINNSLGVVIGLVHGLLPYMVMMLLNSFQRIEPRIEEAATNLGASSHQLFWWVLFPLTRRGLMAGLILVFTISVSSYATPAVMGGGRVLVVATFIEQQMHQLLRYASGSAIAVLLLTVGVTLNIYSKRRLDRGAY